MEGKNTGPLDETTKTSTEADINKQKGNAMNDLSCVLLRKQS
jgi:hypothetical protein